MGFGSGDRLIYEGQGLIEFAYSLISFMLMKGNLAAVKQEVVGMAASEENIFWRSHEILYLPIIVDMVLFKKFVE